MYIPLGQILHSRHDLSSKAGPKQSLSGSTHCRVRFLTPNFPPHTSEQAPNSDH